MKETEKAFQRWKSERVHVDTDILGGTPVFRGTRISVRHVGMMAMRMMVQRESCAVILEDYPDLSAEDLVYAARYVGVR